MYNSYPYLLKLLLGLEFLSCITAVFCFKKLNGSFWMYFCFYLIVLTLSDFFVADISKVTDIKKQHIYAYFIIPLQFIFFYWLYAYQSLQRKRIFWFFILLYILSFIPIELYFARLKVVYSFNYTIGSFLLMILVFLEFQKQIKNDAILYFKQNKMFYINIGIMVFYVGTLPFFGLYNLLVKEPEIWNMYYLYFLLSNCLMYLLFTASFIWGKTKS